MASVRSFTSLLVLVFMARDCYASNIFNPPELPTVFLDIGYKAPAPSHALELATQVCVGLANRDQTVAGAAYTLKSEEDLKWLKLTGVKLTASSNLIEYLRSCVLGNGDKGRKLSKGYIQYNFTKQQIIVPNIVTIAAVLDAVPLEDAMIKLLNISSTPLMDISEIFPDIEKKDTEKAPREATAWVFDRFGNLTTGMAKMNPGFDVHGKHKLNPPLTKMPNLGLVDYIVKERLFNFFLFRGCIPFTKDYSLLDRIVKTNVWKRPLEVYGYDDTFAIAGDLFEAETDCNKEHNMGQIASSGTNNLAFYSRKPAISSPFVQNADPPSIDHPYNDSKIYISFVVGDGDNVNYMKGQHLDWVQERVAKCDRAPNSCFPITWTISPALLHLAPDWIRWYFAQSYKTKNDWFILPPSGHLYSYPGQMNTENQKNFVRSTESDAFLFNTSGTVAWEFFSTWPKAIKQYFPKYGEKGIIKGLFAVNVPYLFPAFVFKRGEHYKILRGNTGKQSKLVLFSPREWRGKLTPSQIAHEVNNYPAGTVTYIYLTSDGGFNLDQLFQMERLLGDHVSIVSPNEIVKRAFQRDLWLQRHKTPIDLISTIT